MCLRVSRVFSGLVQGISAQELDIYELQQNSSKDQNKNQPKPTDSSTQLFSPLL
jgi:hypothetical protein